MGVSSAEIGVVLPGDYVLEERLSSATGHVYRARRQSDGRQFVARIFQPALPLMAADFLELAQTASRIRHPALANVEAYGRLGDKSCFIVSEYVTGPKLDEWADEVGIPPLAQAIELVRRICLSLQAAARSGLAHDTLNPRNVVVLKSPPGPGQHLQVKLLDLGVPAFLASRSPRASAVRFMAPEQLISLASEDRSVAFRCTGSMNVYSCGCLLYYLCTGGPPYPGATVAELRAAQSAGRMAPPVRINPQISPAFNALILHALALDPRDRFSNVGELAEALAHVTGSSQAHGKVSHIPTAATRPSMPFVNAILQHDEDEPPTFKTVRPPDIMVDDDSDGAPTLPPGPDIVTSPPDAGPPMGLFSSAPPWPRPRSPAPPPPLGTKGERPPLALFSEPPPALRAAANIIVAKAEPPPTLLVRPYPAPTSDRAPGIRLGGWVWPLSAAACAVAYFTIQMFVGASATAPVASGKPAANGGIESPMTPEPPAPAAVRTGAQATEAIAAAAIPPSRDDEPTVQPAPAVRAPAQVALVERQRDQRDHGHGRSASRSNRDSRGSDSASAAEAKEEPVEARQSEPALVVPSFERDAGAASARPSVVAEKAAPPEELAPKSVAPKPVAAAAPAPAPARVAKQEPALPLQANVQIQAVAVRGSLPTSLVRRAVERIRSQLVACYARSARAAGRNGFGELSVEVQIDERGRARSPSAHGATLPQLDACVADVTSKLVSEKAPDTGTVNASWKVAFTP